MSPHPPLLWHLGALSMWACLTHCEVSRSLINGWSQGYRGPTMEAHSIWQKLQSKLSVFLNFHLTYMNSYCFIMRITSYLCVCVQTYLCVVCVLVWYLLFLLLSIYSASHIVWSIVPLLGSKWQVDACGPWPDFAWGRWSGSYSAVGQVVAET